MKASTKTFSEKTDTGTFKPPVYYVKKTVKKYFHDHGKRIDAGALEALNGAIEGILSRAIRTTNGHKTVRAGEMAFAYRMSTGLGC